jgi:hypothetical protein
MEKETGSGPALHIRVIVKPTFTNEQQGKVKVHQKSITQF